MSRLGGKQKGERRMADPRYCWMCGGQVFSRHRNDNGLCDPCHLSFEEDDICLEVNEIEKEAV